MSQSLFSKFSNWFNHLCFTIISLGILGGIVVLGSITYYLVFDDTVLQNDALTPDRARQVGCPISLPDEAKRVRFASTHTWFEKTSYVRFNADSYTCRDQIHKILAEHAAQKKLPPSDPIEENVTGKPKMDEWGELGPLPWFSIERIVDGVKVTDKSGKITIWIDDDRGAFFCKITD